MQCFNYFKSLQHTKTSSRSLLCEARITNLHFPPTNNCDRSCGPVCFCSEPPLRSWNAWLAAPMREAAACMARREVHGRACNRRLAKFRQNVARSRLYQNEILQESMRLTAFFKPYTICILLHRCNLKFLTKNRFEKSKNFVKIQQTFCKCCKICKILPNFKNVSLIIW